MSILSPLQASAAIAAHLRPLPATMVPLHELVGCGLAQAIHMERDQPPFERVTMDGIALHSASTARTLRIQGTQAAGAAPLTLAGSDHCIEVMTGAELPTGADCVVPVEALTITNGIATLAEQVTLKPWLNVHRRGSDARAGEGVLQPGSRLTATDIAVIASAGYAQVQARVTPRIALVSTGNELVEPGQPIEPWQVRRSNTYALRAAMQEHGFHRLVDHHIADDLAALRSHLGELLESHDVLVLSGGVSMGKFDFVPQVLTELGVQSVFHKVSQKPGKPFWFGVTPSGKAVFALPGNPVSTIMCLHRYVLPGLHVLLGGAVTTQQVRVSDAVTGHDTLNLFIPVALDSASGAASLRPTRGSGDFISLLGTQGFIDVAAGQGLMAANSTYPFYRW